MAKIVPLESIEPGKAYWVESRYGTGRSIHRMVCSRVEANTVHFGGPFRVKGQYLRQWRAWDEQPSPCIHCMGSSKNEIGELVVSCEEWGQDYGRNVTLGDCFGNCEDQVSEREAIPWND